MKQKLIRAAVAAAATVGIATGSVVAAAPAQADHAPDLVLTGSVSCEWGKPGDPWVNAWHTKRTMTVTAHGRDWPNVTLQEFDGATKTAAKLEKGKSLTIESKWFGCFPTSISGYTISSDIDPLQNNVGFWYSLRSIPTS